MIREELIIRDIIYTLNVRWAEVLRDNFNKQLSMDDMLNQSIDIVDSTIRAFAESNNLQLDILIEEPDHRNIIQLQDSRLCFMFVYGIGLENWSFGVITEITFSPVDNDECWIHTANTFLH